MSGSPAGPSPADAVQELARQELERRRATVDPCWFLDRVRMVDERTGDVFRFHLEEPESGWYWQRHVVDTLHTGPRRTVWLKARQLGLTWLAAGYGNLWVPLYQPGSLTLIYRQNESDAVEIVQRVWEMYQSLPQHLRNGTTVVSPTRGAEPSTVIKWRFPNGRISEVRGLPSTASAGHGRTVAFALLDEFAHIEPLHLQSRIMKAVSPAAGSSGRIAIVSTANGVANLETGEGSYFHYLYANAKDSGFHREFLSWRKHPDRDDEWYANSEEIRTLRSHERAEQYPETDAEAFTFSKQVFFDKDALSWYQQHAVASPLYSLDFVKVGPAQATRRCWDGGRVTVYREPVDGHGYALFVDASSGRGSDFSAATVIDLTNLQIAAEYHGKLEPDQIAYQVHYLGRWYNTAWVAPEVSDGYGQAVMVSLRDGREGRPAYPKLYRHTMESRVDLAQARVYGYPVTTKTRPQITSYAEKLVREHQYPWLTPDLLLEMSTFIEHETGTTPAAQQGTHDDRVMSFCGASELYRQYGTHPDRHRRERRPGYQPAYPWEQAAGEKISYRDRYTVAGQPVDRDGQPLTRKKKVTL